MKPDVLSASKALVGCCIIDSDLSHEVEADWFDDARLGLLVERIRGLLKEGKKADLITIKIACPEIDFPFIQECENECTSTANFSYFKEIVLEAAHRDRLKKSALNFLSRLPESNGNLRSLIGDLENSLAEPLSNEHETLSATACAESMARMVQTSVDLGGKLSGVPTGFGRLDGITNGLQYGELTLVGARPSVGKTAIACNVIEHACLNLKIPTLVFSLEMSSAALCRRIMASKYRIPMGDLKSGELSPGAFNHLAIFKRELGAAPLFIHESFGGMSAGQCGGIIRRLARKHGIKLVILDYLQKLRADGRHEKRTYEIAEASNSLVSAVKETNVATLVMAQLNRESEKDKGRMPRLSDLADSGQIERDADNVFLLHRDRSEPTEARLIVSKQRDGDTGVVDLFYQGKFCRFYNSQPDAEDVPTDAQGALPV